MSRSQTKAIRRPSLPGDPRALARQLVNLSCQLAGDTSGRAVALLSVLRLHNLVSAVRGERAIRIAAAVFSRIVCRSVVALLGRLDDAVSAIGTQRAVRIAPVFATNILGCTEVALLPIHRLDNAVAAVRSELARGGTTTIGAGVVGHPVERPKVALLGYPGVNNSATIEDLVEGAGQPVPAKLGALRGLADEVLDRKDIRGPARVALRLEEIDRIGFLILEPELGCGSRIQRDLT